MGSKSAESRRWESPVLTAPSAVLLTMLSTLVVLFAARRVLPLPAPGALAFAVFAALAADVLVAPALMALVVADPDPPAGSAPPGVPEG